jgi:hypothetical protein
MATVAGQAEYDATDAGFPADAMDFDVVYTEDGTCRRIMERVSFERARAANLPASTGLAPRAYAYHARRLLLVPPTSGVVTIYGDYVRDARRDETSGDPIAATDEGSTNSWVREGEDLLRCRVLMDFYGGAMGSDLDRAAGYERQFGLAIGEATSQWSLLRNSGYQAPWTL